MFRCFDIDHIRGRGCVGVLLARPIITTNRPLSSGHQAMEITRLIGTTGGGWIFGGMASLARRGGESFRTILQSFLLTTVMWSTVGSGISAAGTSRANQPLTDVSLPSGNSNRSGRPASAGNSTPSIDR